MIGPNDPDEEELALGLRQPRRDLLRRLSWRWRAGLLALLVAAVVIPLVATSSHTRTPTAGRQRSAPTTHRPTRSSSSLVVLPAAPKPAVTRIARDFLGIHARWELFGRNDTSIVRIQFARGRVTTTQAPALASSGPVYFLAGDHTALIHPLDFVEGYAVPDGQVPKAEPAHLACGGPALPSPVADEVWVPPCSGRTNRFFLTRLNGKRVGPLLAVPGSRSAIQAIPDGQGYVLLPGYRRLPTLDVQPGRITRVAPGPVLAVGPTRLLLRRCRGHVCHAVVLNLQTGVRQVFHPPLPPAAGPGLIAPNGSAAALTTPKSHLLILLDLRTGRSQVGVAPVAFTNLQPMVWSPDSRWLFGVGFGGELWAVDARTGRVFRNLTLALHIPLLHQLAIRAAPSS